MVNNADELKYAFVKKELLMTEWSEQIQFIKSKLFT